MTPAAPAHAARRRARPSVIATVVRRHWLFVLLVALALVLRVLVTIAYRPAMLYPDSVDYLARAQQLVPTSWHPLGYPLFLRALHVVADITVVVVVQHVMVLVDAFLLYLLLLRFGVVPWLAALGTAPLLLDAFQLDIEQYVLSEAFFETIVAVAFVVLLWQPRPAAWRCAVTGALIAAAAIVRFDGVILIVPALAFVLVRRLGVVRVGTMLAAFILPVVAYCGWYDAVNGQFTVSGISGVFLYGRVVNWVDCRGLHLPSYERPLCPAVPPPDRLSSSWYVSAATSPARALTAHDGRSPNSILESFDLTAIEHQPLDYLNHTLDDYFRQFLPTHEDPKNEWEGETFFQVGYPRAAVTGVSQPKAIIAAYFGGPPPSANLGLDRFLVDYQRVVYTWGPLLGLCLLIGCAGVLGLGRARRSGRRAECLTLTSAGILIFLCAVGTSQFGFRYQLPTLLFVPTAGVLGLAMLWPGGRSPRWPGGARHEAIEGPPEAPSVPEEGTDEGDGAAAEIGASHEVVA